MRKFLHLPIITFLIVILISIGCGKSLSPTVPQISDRTADIGDSRMLWGLWNVQVIPDNNGSAQVIFTPVRSPQLHMNVVGMLENAGLPAVGIEPPVTLKNGILDVKVKLKHPFEVDQLTGFDVRGILIGHGSIGGFSKTFFYAGPDDMELLNPDGHTNLWNPTQYTGKGYVDGKLGKPDALQNYTATLNGYKYFADGLTADMKPADMDKSPRGAFVAGSTNIRRYRIRLGDKGLTFQYAIDANWWNPSKPVEVPGSFDVTRANCPEPWHIDARVGPGITAYGGSANISVYAFDWQKDIDTVYVEAPLLTDQVITLTDPVDMGDYYEFSGSITNENLYDVDSADLLFYGDGTDPYNAKTYTDYRLYHLPIAKIPSGGVVITLSDDQMYKTIGTIYHYGSSDYDYSTGNIPPVDYNDIDGPWDFTGVPYDSEAIRKALAKTDSEVSGFAGDFADAVQYFWKTELATSGSGDPVYQAEQHDYSNNKLKLHGIYEQENLDGSVPFKPPLEFPYPLDKTSHYQTKKTYTIIPFLLTFTVTYERWGLGEGIVFAPVDPGVNDWGWDTQPALLTRTLASFETGGAMGQGLLGTGLVYELIADNGTTYGSIISGNSPDDPPNFDEGTYEITGAAGASALREIE